jgi:beta-lactamase regulating signal transducer with metallopeptidase domain
MMIFKFLQFAFESAIIMAVFTLLYVLLFRNETNFAFIRKLMLFGLVMSICLPSIDIEQNAIAGIPSLEAGLSEIWLPEIVLNTVSAHSDFQTIAPITTISIVQFIYVAGVLFFAVKFIIQLIRLVKILRLPATNCNEYRIIEVADQQTSFSFFKTIVVGHSKTLSQLEKKQILDHEKIHASQFHSADIIVIDLMRIVFWFNPLLRIYKNIMVELHEYEADSRVVGISDVDHYCGLMAKVALQSSGIEVASYFHQSLTIKRIKMIRTAKHKIRQWKLLLSALAITSLVITTACEDTATTDQASEQVPEQATAKLHEFNRTHAGPSFLIENDSKFNETLKTLQIEYGEISEQETFTVQSNGVSREFYLLEFKSLENSSNVFTVVDELPEFPGGFDKLVDFMQANLVMPGALKDDGKTFVSFIIEKDGSLSDIKVIKGFDTAADEEALRVVKLFPQWRPGKQQGTVVRTRMILPVVYKH